MKPNWVFSVRIIEIYLIFDVASSVGILESVKGLHEVTVRRTDTSNHQGTAVNKK